MDKEQKNSLAIIAKKLNISETTVSRALSGNGRVSEKTRILVREAADEIGYRSPSQRRVLGNASYFRQSGSVAVILSRDLLYESAFFHNCLLGATSALAEHHYETLLILCNTDEYAPLKAAIDKGKLDGVIFTRATTKEKSIEYLKKAGIPFVVTGSGIKDAYSVDINTTIACRELASSMCGTGIKHPAFITGYLQYSVNVRRLEGVRMGFSDNRIRLDPLMIFGDVIDHVSCRKAVDTAIHRGADAIICGDDALSVWCYESIIRNGKNVPDDVILASCFDSNDLVHHAPSITAINVNAVDMGEKAGEIMMRLLSNESAPQMYRIEHSIRLRESTRR